MTTMENDRLAQLASMLAEDPGDRFLRYAIALEHKRRGDMERARTMLEELLTDDPKYIAGYYQLALILAEQGRTSDAMAACEAGALQCLVVGDMKARTELRALLAALKGEDDE